MQNSGYSSYKHLVKPKDLNPENYNQSMNNPVMFLYVEDNAKKDDRTVKYSSYMEKFISLQVLISTTEEVAEEVEKVDAETNETYTEIVYKNVTTE